MTNFSAIKIICKSCNSSITIELEKYNISKTLIECPICSTNFGFDDQNHKDPVKMAKRLFDNHKTLDKVNFEIILTEELKERL